MAVVEKKVQVSQEADLLATGIVQFVGEVKNALADGWQPGQDMPLVLQAVLVDLVPAIQAVGKLGAELQENRTAFEKAFALSGVDLVDTLVKK